MRKEIDAYGNEWFVPELIPADPRALPMIETMERCPDGCDECKCTAGILWPCSCKCSFCRAEKCLPLHERTRVG